MKQIPADSQTAPTFPDSRVEQIAESLQAALPTPLWLWAYEDRWCRVGTLTRSATDEDCWEESPLARPPGNIEDRVAEILSANVLDRTGPLTVSLGDDWQLLIAPIPTSNDPRPGTRDQPAVGARRLPGGRDRGAPAVVITAVAQIEVPGVLRELAALAVTRADQARELEQLQGEFEVYTAQITDDFEELSFLRNIAQQLEASDLTKDLVEMAQAVLPLLRTSIKAQSVVLMLPGSAEFGTTISPGLSLRGCGDPAVWCGPRHVDEATCRLIVRRFHRPGDSRAVVKNLWNAPEEAKLLPGVQSLILAPISKAGTHMGWLLAVNRGYRRGFEDVHLLSHFAHHEFGTAEAGLVSSAASMLASQSRNFELSREREELLVKVVRALVNAIEAKDPYTCGHSERVALYGRALAAEIGVPPVECEKIYLAGLLHDVGKIGISDKTLHKPGRLTEEEFAEVKRHPDKGWCILNDLDQLRYVLPGVVHHHERIDGKGYPDGLIGDAIPQDGRILAVADAYDAMTSNRPYREGMPVEKAYEILNEGAGTQWDAAMIDAFNRIRPKILDIQKNYERPQSPLRVNGQWLAGAEASK